MQARRMRPLAALALALLLSLAAPLRAEDLYGRIDPAYSQAGFTLRVLLVRKLEGRFEYLQGAISHAEQPGLFNVDLQVAAQSLQMANPEHALWARSAEFFDAERHPWISFRARNAPQSLLVDGGELAGELSLRGVTRPASVLLLPGVCARPGLDCPLHARGELQRSEFGMDARRWAVSDKVKLAFTLRVRAADGES